MDNAVRDLLKSRIRKARAKFVAMAATYCAGTLNDNFFKQSAQLLAIAAGKSYLQSYATVVFTLPFIFFAAYAGFCADRFSKRSIVIASKALELVAMFLAAAGIWLLNWPLIIATLGVLGLQATLFNPSLNGSIPELYPAEYVPTANAVIRAITTSAMLAGIVCAGFVIDIKGDASSVPLARLIVCCAVVVVSIIGFAVSFAVPGFPAAAPAARFPWAGPLDSVRMLNRLRNDSLLVVAIICSAFFWFIGSLNVLIINQLGLSQFGLSATMTSTLVLIELGGIAAGSLLSAPLSKGKKWYHTLVPAAATIGVCMFLMASVPHLPHPVRKTAVVAALGILGAAGGLFLIPPASFIQVRPAADIKGRVIAASNFVADCGILISGALLYLFNRLGVKPSNCFGLMGIMVAVFTVWLFFVLPKGKKQ